MNGEGSLWPDIRLELLRCKRADDEARAGGEPTTAAEVAAIVAVDRANSAVLRGILQRHGWPGISLVGEEAAEAAWIIAQHADANREFQRWALLLLSRSAQLGEASLKHLAYLTDRCRMHAGQPQVYGTQYRMRDGQLVLHRVEDPERLDTRRRRVGLGPFAEYDARIRGGAGLLIRRPQW
ncbi:DUF6624 domain-containing protein [Streptomyces sp. NPDC059373]